MNRDKQIEEMQKDLIQSFSVDFDTEAKRHEINFMAQAEAFYNAGYRKQRHGTWYHGTENGADYAKCSACGRRMNYSCYGYAYCSLCGARMDGAKMKGGAE